MPTVDGVVKAPIGTVWEVLTDLERWPEWMPTITSLAPRQSTGPAVGAAYRVRQPRLPPTTWTITAWDELDGFTWRAKGLGLATIGDHRIGKVGSHTRVQLSIKWTGPFAFLARSMYGGVARTYIARELQALRGRAESVSSTS
jgi:hypothetical protein